MKTRTFLFCASLVAALALPVASIAQTQPAPAGMPAAAQHHRHGGFMRALKNLNLTAAQKTRIDAIVAQFHKAHPKGSAPNPQAAKAMHDQVMAVLTPAQQAQFKTAMQHRRNTADRNENGADRDAGPQGRGNGMMREFESLNLSDQQKAQIQTLMTQFRQAHPPGSPPDQAALKTMHDQVMAVLTPAQQAQLNTEMQNRPAYGPNGNGGPPGPGGPRGGNRMMERFASLNLSDQQKTQIQNLIAQFRQAHPPGSTRDPQAAKALRDSIFNVLTPQQQAQFKAEMSQRDGGNNPNQPPNR